MADIQLLRLMKHRKSYYQIMGRVPEGVYESTTMELLKYFGKYFDKFPHHNRVELASFVTMLRASRPNMSKEEGALYAGIIGKIKEDLDDETRESLLAQMLELRLGADVSTIILKYENGDVANLLGELEEAASKFKIDAQVHGIDFIQVDPTEILSEDLNAEGLRYRLKCLNDSMRPLRDGDFIILAGRPDKGKTTFIASEVTFMAPQDPRPIVWLNNEGPGRRIYPRLWQAALGARSSDLIAKNQAGTLMTEYMSAIAAQDPNKIRVFDIHGMDTYAVERIVEEHRPSLVVFDMIDNVRGFGDSARQDLALERMYQWARELAVKYSFAGMATSQISADGHDMQFPQQHMLKDSKTGKQGASDAIIMIGAVEDPTMQGLRFIGLPKNKLALQGAPQDPRATVAFNPQIARYEDAEMDAGYDD